MRQIILSVIAFILICSSCNYNPSKSSETIFLENNGFVNDLDGALPFWPRYIANNNILVDQTDAFKLSKEYERLKAVIQAPRLQNSLNC